MKSAQHWPKHFYLIGRGIDVPRHQVSPERMGSKAFNLLRMAQCDLPVSEALVVGTHYIRHPDECLLPLFAIGLPALEAASGLVLGDPRRPLIVSVRSGSPVSMPGMMETLLNVGLCDETLPGLLRATGNPRMVWDAYRRLVASYGEVVGGLAPGVFEEALERMAGGRDERELDFSELRELTRQFLSIYQMHAGVPFPQQVSEQLSGAVRAVFASWDSDKAVEYRRLNGLDSAMGTAVTLQRMVFGNTGGRSGAGVGFTRDPMTGEKSLWIDFLSNAQGEDVVSGRRNAHGHEALASLAPDAWRHLQVAAQRLEQEFGDMQDFEFTVQDGALYMLQSRSGKRTPLAAARIALDLLDEGLIDASVALPRTEALREEDLGTVRLLSGDDARAQPLPLAHALAACSGVAVGELALDAERAAQRAADGVPVVLVRQDAETSDLAALAMSAGLLTQRGARTSHAAVVARQLGKVCLVGCSELEIDAAARTIRIGEASLNEGDIVTLDGNAGAIYAGSFATAMVPDEALAARLSALRAAQDKPRKRKDAA